MQTVTIRDVAKHAGVGVATVSRVLNGNRSVSKGTKAKVLKAIDDLDYTPNAIARSLSSGKTYTIAVIAPFFTRPSYVERLRGIVSIFNDSEYDLVFYNIENAQYRDDALNTVIQRERVDGLILMTFLLEERIFAKLKRSGLPIVLIDAMHPGLSSVMGDDFKGSYEAVTHLIQLGHRRIGFVSDSLEDNQYFFTAVYNRYKGYCQALKDAGIPLSAKYHVQGKHDRAEAAKMAHRLLTMDEPPTAIFAYSDTQAFGVIHAAQALGLNIPEDLSIIGYDDVDSAELMHLSTVRQKLFESGVEGGKLLIQALSDTASSGDTQQIMLQPELVIRKTTCVRKAC